MKKSVLGILIILMFCLTGCGTEPIQMTQAEYDAYMASITHEYKVVSVYPYIYTTTNQYGGIRSQTLRYCFTYIGSDGELHQFDKFRHMESGDWKVLLGDENKYVTVGSNEKFLYLTEETFGSMKVSNEL